MTILKTLSTINLNALLYYPTVGVSVSLCPFFEPLAATKPLNYGNDRKKKANRSSLL